MKIKQLHRLQAFVFATLPLGIVSINLTGCVEVPADPDNTFTRVTQTGVLKVGVIEEPPWAYRKPGGIPAGLEVAWVEDFAGRISAKPQWQFVSEARAIEKLKNQEFDLVIGGLTADSPRRQVVGFTRVYLKSARDSRGKQAKHVLAVPMGENRWLIEVEKFLRDRRAAIRDDYRRTAR